MFAEMSRSALQTFFWAGLIASLLSGVFRKRR